MRLPDELERLLFGRDPRRSVRLLWVAGGLFLLTALLHAPVLFGGRAPSPFGLMVWSFYLAVFVPAVVGAYLNGGLLVSVALASGPSLGFYLPLTLLDLASPGETVLWGLVAGVATAVALGTLGFIVGTGGYRLAAARRGQPATPR